MPLDAIERLGGKLLAWAFALAVGLTLMGLVVATSESLRRQKHPFPATEVTEPDLPRQSPEAPDEYHFPSMAAWPTP